MFIEDFPKSELVRDAEFAILELRLKLARKDTNESYIKDVVHSVSSNAIVRIHNGTIYIRMSSMQSAGDAIIKSLADSGYIDPNSFKSRQGLLDALYLMTNFNY